MPRSKVLSLDDLVESVTLYIRRPQLFHLTIFPFVVLFYPLWIYLWIGAWGFSEHYEGGFIGVAVIGCLQILSCLACYWSVHINCLFTCSKEKNPNKATLIKVVPTANNGGAEIVQLKKQKLVEGSTQLFFVFQKIKYVWDEEKKTFKGIEFPVNMSYAEYNAWKGYQSDEDIEKAVSCYGLNDMDMVVPEFAELFTERATAPFFVFQVFCVALWCLDKYWYYSIFTLVMLVMFECTLVQQQLRNMAEIRNMGNKPYNILVYRNRRWRSIPTNQLIPGDLISIIRQQDDNLVPCDIILIRGSCIVDESMLTGESVPQMKEGVETSSFLSVPKEIFDPDSSDGKFHVLFGGTKVVQHTPPGTRRPPDSGCVAYVIRTGFNTTQGKLLRTILYGVKRVTANNKETFGFILFLLVFAIAAAGYVWVEGVKNPTRNRYKLFLECTLILTSVIPPELPIELSLAVNSSLLALAKLNVYCTEPFRIPFAGKIFACCFDKTGTLTSDDLVVEGVAYDTADATPISRVSVETRRVLAVCHSLVRLEKGGGVVGDPLEKAMVRAVDWAVGGADTVLPVSGSKDKIKILTRHHFSSQLKRMSVVAVEGSNANDMVYIAAVKGAPETLSDMFSEKPTNYDDVYLELSRRGARVLALGYKELGRGASFTSQDLRDMTRDHVESKLKFAGFVIVSCPLKTDSKSAIAELQYASHRTIMITGDNALTACHVANQLRMTSKPILILNEKTVKWESVDKTVQLSLDDVVSDKYELCLTGDSFEALRTRYPAQFNKFVPRVTVFARFAPKQKEMVVTKLKESGQVTLMCGDGTNDVGALRHAHVGVAILARDQSDVTKRTKLTSTPITEPSLTRHPNNVRTVIEQRNRLQNRLNKMVKDLEEEERSQVVKLGDASVAAPFTSKMASIGCVCQIIKQGRCTLVTTLQMFKILALNALIFAYTQSVLYLDGIKLRDMQATLQGFLLAASFLFISRSKPLKTLSKQRPLPNIFNLYTMATVMLQFAVHFVALIYLVNCAKTLAPEEYAALSRPDLGNGTDVSEDWDGEEEEPFEPNLINSTVFVISMALQLATFAINYRGKPFMESLWENKPLLWSIVLPIIFVLTLAMGLMPELSTHFEIVDFPDEFKQTLLAVLLADFLGAFAIDRICRRVCGVTS